MDRKKRKLGELDASAQPVSTSTKPESEDTAAVKANTQKPPTARVLQPEPASTAPKLSARASKKARKQKEGNKPVGNPKHQLVRTVALGNLQPDTKAAAISLAEAAGKVYKIVC